MNENLPLIIAWFAWVWKTTLAKKYSNVIDLESSIYKRDNSGMENVPVEARKWTVRKENINWPQNYLNAIESAKLTHDVILVWIHPDVLEIYDKNNITYSLCYPNKESLQFYENRYIGRWNNQKYIDKVLWSYDRRYDEFWSNKNQKIILNWDETLEDYLLKNKLVKLCD